MLPWATAAEGSSNTHTAWVLSGPLSRPGSYVFCHRLHAQLTVSWISAVGQGTRTQKEPKVFVCSVCPESWKFASQCGTCVSVPVACPFFLNLRHSCIWDCKDFSKCRQTQCKGLSLSASSAAASAAPLARACVCLCMCVRCMEKRVTNVCDC